MNLTRNTDGRCSKFYTHFRPGDLSLKASCRRAVELPSGSHEGNCMKAFSCLILSSVALLKAKSESNRRATMLFCASNFDYSSTFQSPAGNELCRQLIFASPSNSCYSWLIENLFRFFPFSLRRPCVYKAPWCSVQARSRKVTRPS